MRQYSPVVLGVTAAAPLTPTGAADLAGALVAAPVVTGADVPVGLPATGTVDGDLTAGRAGVTGLTLLATGAAAVLVAATGLATGATGAFATGALAAGTLAAGALATGAGWLDGVTTAAIVKLDMRLKVFFFSCLTIINEVATKRKLD